MISLIIIFLVHSVLQENVVHGAVNETGCKTLESDYSMLLKLIHLEEKVSKQEATIKEQGEKIEILTADTQDNRRRESHSSTYIRWGRKSCPSGATEVYQGYTAGSHYTHTGGAAKPLCLTNKPTWGRFTDKQETYGALIYGAEYETWEYSTWAHFLNHDVPCIVCRVPKMHVLMVPGTKVCPYSYSLQYSGYLMAGHYKHAAPSQFICVDGNPETINRSYGDLNGYLLYFVQAQCGSLSCGPYFQNREITCAVCSFIP